MFRANIYTIEQLPEQKRQAVNEGIEMVAAFMGQSVVSKEFKIRMRQNDRGMIDPRRIGFSNFDSLVELHLMVVPLEPDEDPVEGDRVGVAGLASGWAFVNSINDSMDLVRCVSAHETAHAFGFLDNSTSQIDPNSSAHCLNEACLMHKSGHFVHLPSRLNKMDKLKHTVLGSKYMLPDYTLTVKQQDFCLSCKVDLRSSGDKHINILRMQRLEDGKVLSPHHYAKKK